MEFIIKKFCNYLLNGKKEEELKEINTYLEKYNLSYKSIKKLSQKELKKMKKEIESLGFPLSRDGFNSCLQYYINIKDSLSDEEKTNYLHILMPISELFDINLKEELKQHISYKQIISRDKLLNKFCRYQINSESTVEEYNDLHNLCITNNYDFNELQTEALSITEPLKEEVEQLGFNTDFNSYCLMLDKYVEDHSSLSEDKKEEYLRTLHKLSSIYEVDLRGELTNYLNNKNKPDSDYTLPNIIKNLTNPLNSKELLNTLLKNRLEDGYFSIQEIKLSNYKEPEGSTSFDYTKIQSELTKYIFDIYINKINNYMTQDLNKEYLSILSEEDIPRLSELSEKDIFTIIQANKKGISIDKILKKLNISESLYKFINIALETTDFTIPHIGVANNSLFNTNDTFYTIRIYINTPNTISNPKFLSEYIKACIDKNISYDITGINEEKTIIYATENDIEQKLEILDKIARENPELINTFGTPNYGGGTLNKSYYSISHAGLLNENNSCMYSYNDYFNSICEVAYYRTIAKIIINKVTKEEEKQIIESFINYENIEFIDDYSNPLQATYNNIDFSSIKDLINTYIPLIINTLKKYVEEKDNLAIEFKKACLYLSNICEGREKKEDSNIAISRYLENIAYKKANKKM